MAQRPRDGSTGPTGRPPGGRPPGGRTAGGGSRRRPPVAPVKKPFPYGFAVGVLVLVLALGGVLYYAARNTGAGFKTAAETLDSQVQGVQVTKNLSANHVTSRVAYPDEGTRAPDGGNHNPYPQTCAVYDAPVVPEHAVHSMEHGAVWVTYRPDLPADQVDVLKGLVEGNDYRLLSPYPGQGSAVALQAWGRRLDVPSATDPRVQEFLDGYTNGPQTREKGASCAGVEQPGTVPFVVGPDGRSFVPGTATTSVPAQGDVPSQAPVTPAPATGSAVPDPTVPAGQPTATSTP